MKTKRSAQLFRFGILAILALMLCPVAIFAFAASPGGAGKVMAAALGITMLDLAKLNSGDAARGIVEENAGAIPEWSLFPAEQLGAGKLKYETLIRSGYPSAGFVDVGGGFTNSKSLTRMETFETYPFGGRVQAAQMIADNYSRGGAAGYFAFEASGIGKSAMFALAKQIYYGRVTDGKGFPGLKNFTAFGTTVTDPITGRSFRLCLDATGSTASSASSAYLVKFSTDTANPNGVQVEFGTGSVFELPDPLVQDITDPNDSAKMLRVYASVLQGWAGLAIPNIHCVRRICNLTAQTGKGMSDALLADAASDWPQGVKPDAIIMSARSRKQLQLSRTVTLFGQGSGRPNQPLVAPLPTEYDGIPIVVSDAIADTDAIETSAASEE